MAKTKKSTKKKSSSKRRTSRSKRSSSTVRTTTRKGKRGITWTEAAVASGATYGAKYPRWHEKAGQSTGSRKGKAMSKYDALRGKRRVVGYLSKSMLDWWYKPQKLVEGMPKITPAKISDPKDPRWEAAQALFKKYDKEMAKLRKTRGTPWKRQSQRYKRGPKKGQKKKDYKVVRGKVKFRSGRGPRSSVRVVRGFSPTKKQIDRLVAGGFAGHLSAPGGKVKLNKPRRRKKARKARRNPAKRRRTSSRKRTNARKNPRRRKKARRKGPKATAYNPKRRRRRRKKAKARKNPVRRRRRRRKAKARKNPVRRRRRRKAKATRKNPGRRRRRRRRSYRKNPMGLLRAMFNDLKSTPKWITAGHILVGAGTTAASCGWLLTRGPLSNVRFLQQRGIVGSVSRLALCGMAAGGIAALGDMASKALGRPKLLQGARTNLLIGGFAYALANFLYEMVPGAAGMLMIPQVSAPARGGSLATASMEGWGPDYRYGYGGMGAVMSPEDVVAGESLARQVNEFHGMGDWMELSGLGSSGGAPIPMEDLRGYPGQYGAGMGDWVELTSNNELVKAGFNPGVEAF